MSRFEIKMPKLGESITEGTIISWSVQVGDIIKEDDVLFEVNTAKVSAEIPSPVEGKVVEILFKEGDTVAVGTVVAPVPDAEQLAQIAVCTARTAKAVVGMDPKVAMLSFSTKGSAKHEVVDKVVEAVKLAKEMDPDLAIDGELQADAALVPEVGASKAPGSAIAGNANVLVVPSLEVGNISYKLVQRLGHADAVGPILQGIARPVNDLSRGCSIEDVYRMIAITANQAIAAKNQK